MWTTYLRFLQSLCSFVFKENHIKRFHSHEQFDIVYIPFHRFSVHKLIDLKVFALCVTSQVVVLVFVLSHPGVGEEW